MPGDYDDDFEDFEDDFESDSGLVEQDANMNEIKYFASEFLIQRFLGLTPDDLRLNKKLKEIEDAESLENAKKAAAIDL